MRTLWTRLRYAGLCTVCGHRGLFGIRPEYQTNLREALGCPRCESISRDRFVALCMSRALGRPDVMARWPVDKSIRILEPSGFRGRPRMLAEKTDYVPISYPGETLERLTYPDASFSHVVAADVFEHVRRDEEAFREVHRVLRPGGFLFLQVPYDHDRHTFVRVQPVGDEDRHVLPPQYHDAEHSLVYRIYGHDLLARLGALGFEVTYVSLELPRRGISRQDMILAQKPI